MFRCSYTIIRERINPLNAELNRICHLLALLGGATIVVVSRLRVNIPPVMILNRIYENQSLLSR
jgi:hypothetical protein